MARKEAAPRREPLSSPLGKINQDAESHPTQQNSRERPRREARPEPTHQTTRAPTRVWNKVLGRDRLLRSCFQSCASSSILQHNSQVIKDATQQRTCSLLMLSVYVKHGAWALATHHASAQANHTARYSPAAKKASAELFANDNSEGAGR